MNTTKHSEPAHRGDHLLSYAAGGIVLLPLFIWRREFSQLFWFGDDWDLLDQIQHFGFWHWTWQVFAENFEPLFKALWGGCAYLFHGSYFCMIAVMWLTHALNTVRFGRLLRGHDFPWLAVLTAQIIFGLTPANLETLGWSVQWSAVLATTFLLLALEWQSRARPQVRMFSWSIQGPLVAYCAASALSFSRGVLTGLITALAVFWPEASDDSKQWSRRSLTALLCLLPAMVTALLIAAYASGNQQHLNGHILIRTSVYGFWFFCLNPLYRLLEMDSWGLRTVWLLGGLKLALILWGLACNGGRRRKLLALLLAFDLGNCALVGIGRFHTGLATTTSSRYQYGSLLCLAPFIGLWLNHVLSKIPLGLRFPRFTAAASLAILTVYVSHRWPQEIRDFSAARGTETRRVLTQDAHVPPMGSVPGIPFLSTDRAKELIRIYHLH
jgi:hypothetical protein